MVEPINKKRRLSYRTGLSEINMQETLVRKWREVQRDWGVLTLQCRSDLKGTEGGVSPKPRLLVGIPYPRNRPALVPEVTNHDRDTKHKKCGLGKNAVKDLGAQQ